MEKQEERLVAFAAYQPVHGDELTLGVGDRLVVLHSYDDGWVLARNEKTGAIGLSPRNFLQSVESVAAEPRAGGGRSAAKAAAPDRTHSLVLRDRRASTMPESNQQGTSRQAASSANAPVAAHGGAVRMVSAEDAKRKMEQIATGRRTRARAGADTGRIKVAFVGDSGIGKTSMILQMMRTSDIISTDPILPSKSEASPLGPTSLTIQEFRASTIPPLSLDISEDRFNLSFIDTPGYGSTLDALSVIRPVVAYHVAQFQRTDQAFTREATPLQLMRFLSAPTGAHTHIDVAAYCMLHRITGVDVHYLKRLSKVVSVVPVVIRSDTMTVDEAFAVKREIIEVLHREGIETFSTGLSKDELLALASAKVAGAPPYVVSARAPKPISGDGRVEYEGRKVLNEIEAFKDTVLFLHTDELRRGTADRFVRWRSAGSPKDID